MSDKTFEPPATWTHMDEKENLKVVPLVSTGQEYKDVVKKFTDTARGVNVEFVKVIFKRKLTCANTIC